SRRILVACAIAIATKGLAMSGAATEIISFRPWVDNALVGGILSYLIVLVVFAELYWQLDQDDDEKHFGFASVVDAYYFSTVTSSSVGFGDILPKSNRAKLLTMAHILAMFFVMLPVVLKALEK
ncbi:unnamed protein product, partial [Hapterophycus canaliculatus]